MQVFTSMTHSAVLTREVVEFVGLSRISQLGQHFKVKVVKFVSPLQMFASPVSKTQNALIGPIENIEQMEQQLVREITASAYGAEYVHRPYRENGHPESAQQHSYDREQEAYERHPPTLNHETPVVVNQPTVGSTPSLQVNGITMQYLNEFLPGEQASIEKKCKVKIKWSSSTDSRFAMLTVVAASVQSDVTTAKEKVEQICRGISNQLEEARLPMPKDTYEAMKIHVNLANYRALMSHENTQDGPMCIIIGPRENVIQTKEKVIEVLKTLPKAASISLASLTIKGRKICVKRGNLISESVDAIVNGANECLRHMGGVAQAIVDAGGKEIQDESDEIVKRKGGRLNPGDAVATKGGNLTCKFVIHAVAPAWERDRSAKTLEMLKLTCYNALKVASEKNLKSIAMPGLGSGIFGMPKDKCATTLFTAVEDFFSKVPSSSVVQVIFINIDDETAFAFEKECKTRASIGRSHSTNQSTAECSICCESPTKKNPMIQLPCDSEHRICRSCRCKLTSPVCPFCQKSFGIIVGNQPKGSTMHAQLLNSSLPGYESNKTIKITYNLPSGVQTEEHPTPGQPYSGTMRIAYLPDSKEGREVLDLLQIAFERRLTFTIGRSVTSGQDGVITWDDIHHKTRRNGGADHYGYPDPGYLQRVKKELESKGVI
ncbi:uncharacterized protein [Oscarella lobularis]